MFLAYIFHPSIPFNLHQRLPRVSGAIRTALCFGLSAILPLHADDRTARALADLSIEELMNESVTSVAKKEQKLGDVASAITVLSNDDLRRSGATTLADALRGVPGLAVGSLNASERAVSARGFNITFANKQLVLVDGRAVYNPIYSGVFWDIQQPMLEDVERVEVIRGPGATVWGANAVNGVISVISRSARDTQGGLVFGAVDSIGATNGGLRYGGQIGSDTYYRVCATHRYSGEGELADGTDANDAASSRTVGFRLDKYSASGAHATWQAEALEGSFDGDSDTYNFNTLGRLSLGTNASSGVEAQVYFDRTYRDDHATAENAINTLDLSLQQTFRLGKYHHVIWGGGFRYIHNDIGRVSPVVEARQDHFTLKLFSAFVQDEVKLIDDRLAVTFGVKAEHTEVVGLEFQPSIRAMFKPARHQTVWAAISRALRTPNVMESQDVYTVGYGEPFPTPGGLYQLTLQANPEIRSEVLHAYELGYRIQPNRHYSIDLASFLHDYTDLMGVDERPTFKPAVPVGAAYVRWANLYRAQTYGAELSMNAALSRSWRVTGAYSTLRRKLYAAGEGSASIGTEAPRHQVSLRSSHDFGTRASLDAQLRFVSRFLTVPGYETADLRFAWRYTDNVELSLTARNLLDPRHPEQPQDPLGIVTSEVPRTFQAKITWRFR